RNTLTSPFASLQCRHGRGAPAGRVRAARTAGRAPCRGWRVRHAHPAGAARERRPAGLPWSPLRHPRPARGEGPPSQPSRGAEPVAGWPAAALCEGERFGSSGAASLAGHAAPPLGRPGSGAGEGRVTSHDRRPPAAARLLAALFPPRDAAAEAAIADLEEEYT